MPIDPDELLPRKKAPEVALGENLDTHSVHELEARIQALESEIQRCKEAIVSRNRTHSAAEAFFKR